MATWGEFEADAPDLAVAIRARFDGHLHHVLGTLTADGSPRLSGTEARFHDGQLWLGCMPRSAKARDLRRDPRFALHSAPVDVTMADGDAKVSGRVIEVTDEERVRKWLTAVGHGGQQDDSGSQEASADQEQGDGFDVSGVLALVCDLASATLTQVAGDHLDITTWTPETGVVVRQVQ